MESANIFANNHIPHGIGDQLFYFEMLLKNKLKLKFIDVLGEDRTTILIENFNPGIRKLIQSKNIKIGVLLTEFLDFDEQSRLLINSEYLLEDRSYIKNMKQRFGELVKLLLNINYFIRHMKFF